MNRVFLFSMLIISYYISLFTNWESMHYMTGVLALMSLVFSIPKARMIYRVMGSIFTVVGLLLYIQQSKELHQLPLYMTSTVTLLSVMFVLPFINSAVIVGRYDRNVNKLLKEKADHLGQLYNRTSFVSFLLGSFLNIATLPLVNSVIEKNLQHQPKALKDKFISQSMLRGYALSLSWSPIELMIILSLDITNTNYLTIFPLLIVFVILMFFLNMFFSKRYQKISLYNIKEQVISTGLNRKVIQKIISLLFYLVLFISIIVALNRYTTLGFLEIVTLVVIPYSLLWAFSIRRIQSYLTYSIPRWKVSTQGLSNYMALFLPVGFFTRLLNESHLVEYIHAPFEVLASIPLMMFFFIQILFLGLAMVGFHPLVTISILGGVLVPFLDVINPVSLAIVLATSGLSTIMAGPFNISVSIASNLLLRNPYQISYWNILYASMFSSVGTLIAVLVQLFQ